MTDTATTDVAVRGAASPAGMVAQYESDFALLLPSHIKPAQFVRVAQGALRQNRELARAAASDPASLMSALMEAARLGLEPGTDEYYLTPRSGKVLGIVGWKGEVELITRSGAVSAVISEVVREGDEFEWTPGLQDRPVHRAGDWFDRPGEVRGAYAYAVMKDGATSKVVIVGKQEIKRAMDASGTAKSSHSPWTTDYAAMVRKTAVHQLADWVPTSAEYRREQLRAAVEAHTPDMGEHVDIVTGEIVEVTVDAD